jgi:transcription elongation factor Elf1
MSNRTANDNIKTSHLKCEHCGTRTHLSSITSRDGREIRSFECGLCGRKKILQISKDSGALLKYSLDAC